MCRLQGDAFREGILEIIQAKATREILSEFCQGWRRARNCIATFEVSIVFIKVSGNVFASYVNMVHFILQCVRSSEPETSPGPPKFTYSAALALVSHGKELSVVPAFAFPLAATTGGEASGRLPPARIMLFAITSVL